eukprot:TRINITY_DN5322_c0_g1_i1.p1 TRINITY_DN5322_c0_g1~~TRINITY_DN5322_c0_g1_i1.p1  ORF type:complete len:585 (+),score=114.94 TRINITY_DN5322_c0_g1_i1:60-1757(+)
MPVATALTPSQRRECKRAAMLRRQELGSATAETAPAIPLPPPPVQPTAPPPSDNPVSPKVLRAAAEAQRGQSRFGAKYGKGDRVVYRTARPGRSARVVVADRSTSPASYIIQFEDADSAERTTDHSFLRSADGSTQQSVYSRGECVVYQPAPVERPATVVVVDRSTVPVSYIVSFEDGSGERATEEDRLAPAPLPPPVSAPTTGDAEPHSAHSPPPTVDPRSRFAAPQSGASSAKPVCADTDSLRRSSAYTPLGGAPHQSHSKPVCADTDSMRRSSAYTPLGGASHQSNSKPDADSLRRSSAYTPLSGTSHQKPAYADTDSLRRSSAYTPLSTVHQYSKPVYADTDAAAVRRSSVHTPHSSVSSAHGVVGSSATPTARSTYQPSSAVYAQYDAGTPTATRSAASYAGTPTVRGATYPRPDASATRGGASSGFSRPAAEVGTPMRCGAPRDAVPRWSSAANAPCATYPGRTPAQAAHSARGGADSRGADQPLYRELPPFVDRPVCGSPAVRRWAEGRDRYAAASPPPMAGSVDWARRPAPEQCRGTPRVHRRPCATPPPAAPPLRH